MVRTMVVLFQSEDKPEGKLLTDNMSHESTGETDIVAAVIFCVDVIATAGAIITAVVPEK